MSLSAVFDERQNYLKEQIRLLDQLSIILPLLLVATMSFIYFGLVSSNVFHPGTYFIISAGFLAIIALRLLIQNRTFIVEFCFFLAHNILGACTLLFITGVDSPFTIFWLALLLGGYANFAKRGYILSTVILLATTTVYILMLSPAILSFYLTIFFYCCFISVLGYILARLMHLTRDSQVALQQTQSEEATQRDRLNTLLNSIGEAVITTDPNGIIMLQNAAVLALFDTNKSVIGFSIDDILHLTDENNNPVAPSSLLKNKRSVMTRSDLTHHFDGTDTIRLIIQITPIRTSFKGFSDPGFVFIMRDITKEKTLEEERDEFISVVSHELRTPVTIAEGSLSNLMLLQARSGDNGSAVVQTTKTAYDQVLYLAKMVNDLSTLSRAERGVGDAVEAIDLHELLVTLYKKYAPEAKAKKLLLELDAPVHLPKVNASRLYLEEMLQNFITNAIKYTAEGSVTLHGHKTAKGVRLAVSDTGIGISKSDQSRIFNKFYRAEDYRIRETSGTGLGLYVVKKLAAKLGIKIEFKSRLNHGSEFGFILPLKK
ncbi:MAG TPA: ATP-binding protein [Candidatus Saccharimonadales bacterium]